MPEFIVTQTAKEYSDYQKKKEREINRIVLFWYTVLILGFSGLCWWLQP